MESRIAAIFAADMVGSTRLMERDEAEVLMRHKSHLAEVFEPAFSRHRGKVIKGTGDGLIGVFDSVVDAVQCAVAIQRDMKKREAESDEDRRICYRIGINLGDVIFDEGDVYGDGVNVAARLEGLAEPGGIVVSGTAHNLLKEQIQVGYRSLGAVPVKNVSTPVVAFQILDDPSKAGQISKKRRPSGLIATFALAAFSLVVAGAWWISQPDFEPADPEKMAYRLPETPTLAIADFENIKSDAEDDYLGRSLTEALVVKMTGSPALTVIQATKSIADGTTEIAQIAEVSSARYVLHGSYLREGDGLQVTARLADALDGRQIWAETFQRLSTAADFFDIQDTITDSVSASVNIELSTSDLYTAYRIEGGSLEDLLLGVEAGDAFQQWDATGNAAAMQIYTDLLERFPNSASANTTVAWAWWQQAILGIAPPQEVFPVAAKHATKALELDPTFAGAYAVLTWVALPAGQFDAAERYIDQHIKLSNGSPAPGITGALLAIDRPLETERISRKIMREQPRHHDFVPRNLALSLMQQGKFKEAAEILRGIIASDTRDARLKVQASTDLVVLTRLTGEIVESDQAVRELLALAPKLTIQKVGAGIMDKSGKWKATYLDALREAGIPDG